MAVTGSGTPSAYNLTATLTSNPAAVGTVTFTEGDTVLASDVSIVSGRAVTTPLDLGLGSHDITATFTPGQSNFKSAEGSKTLVIQTGSKLSESFPASVAKGAKAKGSVTVTADGATATGTVKIMKGSKTLGTAKLKNGVAKFTLKLSKGKNSLKAVYAGDDAGRGLQQELLDQAEVAHRRASARLGSGRRTSYPHHHITNARRGTNDMSAAIDETTTLPPVPAAPLAELRAKEITAWFGDHKVLDRVSLTMPAGGITALIGPSGCGKSTFLRILNRMHELVPSAQLAGEVLLDGEDIYDPQKRLIDARRSIGMVFQKPNPFPAMSIRENVLAGLKLTGTKASRSDREGLVESCLRKGGLWEEVKDRLDAPGGGLSGGQQQRLCIARSLAIKPRVLLMDEPCSALDPTSTRVIEETMKDLAREVTIVIVTHNMQQAARVSDTCAFFLASQGTPGVIVEHGDTAAMFQSPRDPRTSDYVHGRFG